MNHNLTSSVLLVIGALSVTIAQADTTGNRYGFPVLYKSEISSAKAWLDVSQSSRHDDNEDTENQLKPVILDVRRIEEYVAGHPVGAYSIPFPHVTGTPSKHNDSTNYIGYKITVDPVEVGFLATDGKDGTLSIQSFVDYVESKFPNKDQPLYLLCATGHRSVQAANALAKYGHYTQIRNIWEGYNGQPKYAYTGPVPTVSEDENVEGKFNFIQLDLNNDGFLDGNDRDGWAFFQSLPTETKLDKKRLFKPYISLYTAH